MLSSKIDALLKFQPPSRELLQQSHIHTTAKRYYDFFGFSDNALVFLKRYVTENFALLNYFDQSSVLLTQTCHNFYAAWPKLHQDPSPLISVLLMQLQNILSMASSLSPLEFKVEDEAREAFAEKINSIKDLQVSIDKKFQSLWKQCHNQTAIYYQKLEEYKEQSEKVREKYEKYEKETRDFKGYNVTLVRSLEEKLNEKVLELMKSKEAFEKVCEESQESYNAVLRFFDSNKGLLEEFLKLFLRTIIEVTIFLIERVQQNFVQLKQTTQDVLQAIKRLNLKCSWESEAAFIKNFSFDQKQQIGQIKDINRINHHRQELVNAMGFLSQESLHLCQESIDKFVYFEEIHIFREFFSQFDPKISANLLPLADLLTEFKNSFTGLFNSEKSTNEQIVHKIASQRFKSYSALVTALSKSQQADQLSLDASGASVKNAVSHFLQNEESLAKDYVKDLERLYTAMNQEVWNKMIQGCQKLLGFFRDRVSEEKLTLEVQRIQDNMVQALGKTETIEKLESARKLSTESECSTEENVVVAEERVNTNMDRMNKYNSGYKFIKEKKAESLAEYVRRQNEERLKEINPSPYTVEFEGKGSVSNSDDEPVLDSFACAFVEKMLLQGRIYITSAKIVFKSYFNGRTLFGSTVLYIPLRDIVHVVKKKNVLGIENMIEITTRKGTLLFTSFIFRDKAFDMIQKIMTTMQPKYARNLNRVPTTSPHAGEAIEEEFVENVQGETAAVPGESAESRRLKKQRRMELEYQKRNREILKAMPPLSKYDQLGYKYQYPADLNTFFRVFSCKSPVEYKGKNYKSCWEIFEEIQGTYQIDIQDWNKELPNDITNKKNLLDHRNYIERFCIGRKRLNISIPFVPKEISFEQQNKLFLVNEKQVVIILEVETKEKIPLSDTFKFRTCYLLTDETGSDGKPLVSMSFNYYVEWFKSTMLKPVLLKAANEEIKETGAKIDKIIRDLMEAGLFQRKKEELEASKQAEISIEDEEVEENVENGGNNVELEEQEQEAEEQAMLSEGEKNVGMVQEQVGAVKQANEFKVSKKILFIYFSVSLIIISFIFMRQLLKV